MQVQYKYRKEGDVITVVVQVYSTAVKLVQNFQCQKLPETQENVLSQGYIEKRVQTVNINDNDQDTEQVI